MEPWLVLHRLMVLRHVRDQKKNQICLDNHHHHRDGQLCCASCSVPRAPTYATPPHRFPFPFPSPSPTHFFPLGRRRSPSPSPSPSLNPQTNCMGHYSAAKGGGVSPRFVLWTCTLCLAASNGRAICCVKASQRVARCVLLRAVLSSWAQIPDRAH